MRLHEKKMQTGPSEIDRMLMQNAINERKIPFHVDVTVAINTWTRIWFTEMNQLEKIMWKFQRTRGLYELDVFLPLQYPEKEQFFNFLRTQPQPLYENFLENPFDGDGYMKWFSFQHDCYQIKRQFLIHKSPWEQMLQAYAVNYPDRGIAESLEVYVQDAKLTNYLIEDVALIVADYVFQCDELLWTEIGRQKTSSKNVSPRTLLHFWKPQFERQIRDCMKRCNCDRNKAEAQLAAFANENLFDKCTRHFFAKELLTYNLWDQLVDYYIDSLFQPS